MNSTLSLPGLIEEQPELATDMELLSLLLAGGRTHETASMILKHFAGWPAIWNASTERMAEVPGMGPEKLGRWLMLREVVRRSKAPAKVVGGSRDATQYFAHLQSQDQEVVSAAFLYANHELIRVVDVFRGTISEALAQPREILREALKVNAAKFILAHNHLSSDVEPSEKDKLLTARMEWAGEVVGVPLLDHLIIGPQGQYYSFAEAGLTKTSKSSHRPRRGSVLA